MNTFAEEPLPILLTYRQAVKVSGLGRGTLRKLVEDGRITRRKIGRSVWLESASIVKAIEGLPKG